MDSASWSEKAVDQKTGLKKKKGTTKSGETRWGTGSRSARKRGFAVAASDVVIVVAAAVVVVEARGWIDCHFAAAVADPLSAL